MSPSALAAWWNGFPVAFALTCAIELPAYVLAFAALGWCRPRSSPHRSLTILSALAVALAVNLITHPLLWAFALGMRDVGLLLIAELVVAAVEGLIIFAVVLRRRGRDSVTSRLAWSLTSAVGVNTLSLLVGLVLLPSLTG